MKIKYSIVVPTRNRPAYLAYALRTLAFPVRTDVEIIISDNSDVEFSEETRRVVISLSQPVLKYIRPLDAPLAMSRHWEWALRHARGDYVTVVGDDDGFLPYTLAAVDEILAATKHEVITWEWAVYFWPDSRMHSSRLIVPLHSQCGKIQFEIRDPKEILADVVDLRTSYFQLPMVYNSFVSQKVLQLFLGTESKVFASQSPDIYSGMAIAHLAKKICCIQTPLAIAGQSGKSNGAATLSGSTKSEVTNDFHDLNVRQGLDWPTCVPALPVLEACIAESYFRLCQRFAIAFRIDKLKYINKYCDQLRSLKVHESVRKMLFERLIQTYSSESSMARVIWRASQLPLPVVMTEHKLPLGLTPAIAYIAAEKFGTKNVFEASQLLANIFPPETPLRISERDLAAERWSAVRSAIRLLLPRRLKNLLSDIWLHLRSCRLF